MPPPWYFEFPEVRDVPHIPDVPDLSDTQYIRGVGYILEFADVPDIPDLRDSWCPGSLNLEEVDGGYRGMAGGQYGG